MINYIENESKKNAIAFFSDLSQELNKNLAVKSVL